MVGLIFKLVVCFLLLLCRFSMDKDILYTKLKLTIANNNIYQLTMKMVKEVNNDFFKYLFFNH